jgi:hypothetical protein
MRSRKNVYLLFLAVANITLLSIARGTASISAADDPLGAAVEAAGRTHDENQLQAVKTQLEQKIAQNANDAGLTSIWREFRDTLRTFARCTKTRRPRQKA